MNKVRAIGLTIYTYSVLEEKTDQLWEWFQKVEKWSGRFYEDFVFASRDKESSRIWRATSKNKENLYGRLQTELPWDVLIFSWPKNSLRSNPYHVEGVHISMKSCPQPWKGGESYRIPSYLSIIFNPDILFQFPLSIEGFLQLGIEAWEIIQGVYGFVDVETGVPLQDNLLRNIAHIMSNLVPPDHFEEFQQWQSAIPVLDKKIWKPFWGNFLGSKHIEEIGGFKELRKADPYTPYDEVSRIVYEKGIEILRNCQYYEEWHNLKNKGVLLTLSQSPTDWFQEETQTRREGLGKILKKVAISI